MIDIDINPDLINQVYWPLRKCKDRVQIVFGGSSSGKSYFLASRLVADLMEERNYLVCRNVGATLRRVCVHGGCKSHWLDGCQGSFP
jgi:phage terminase large subunit